MAKKTKQLELDDFGFADLDMPDFDFDAAPPKDDRSAITKTGTGFLKGAKDSVVSEAAVRRLIKDGLPKGYGSTVDTLDQGARTLRNLYNNTAREVRPAYNELKQTTERLLPSIKPFLPQKLYGKAEKWASSAKKAGSADLSAAEQREADLQSMLGEVFKNNLETEAKREAKRDVSEKMRDQTAMDRHTDSIGQLNAMRLGIQQMAEYQSKVDSAFQRRALEVAYRHYFLAGDMHVEQKRQGAFLESSLAGIVKNTGLPEFAKLKGSERMHEMLRNKFLDSVTGGLMGRRGNFISNVGNRLSSAVRGRVSDGINQLRMGMSMAESVAEMQQMQKEMGMQSSGWETGGSMAGGMVADSLMGRAGKKLGSWTRQHKGIMRTGNRLQYEIENLPQNSKEWAKDYISDGSIWGTLKQVVADAVNSSMAEDNGLEQDTLGGMNQPDIWRRQSNKTLNEVIPGFLSRILREIQIFRTGDANIGLTTYDFNGNKFTSQTAARKSAFGKIVSEGEAKTVREDLDTLINKVDVGRTLTPEQRKALGKQLLRDNMTDRGQHSRRLTDPNAYQGEASRHGTAFADLFADYLQDDEQHEKRLELGRDIAGLGKWMSDSRAQIQHMVNVGDYDGLRDMGLLDSNGQINMTKLYDYYAGDEYNPQEGSAAALSAPGGRRRKQRHIPARVQAQHLKANRTRPPDRLEMDVPQFMRQGVQVDENCTCAEKIIAAINENTTKRLTESMDETLKRIEQRLNEGLIVHNVGGEGGEGSLPAGWLNRTMGQNMSALGGFGRRWFNRGRDFVANRTRQGLTTINNARKWGMETAQGLFKKGRDKWTEFNDVYIKGKAEPVLQAWRLRAGEYYDQATGQVIKSWKDIKGAVTDKDGNIIMTAEELKDAFAKTKAGEKLLSALGAVQKFGKMGLDSIRNHVPAAWNQAFNGAKGVFNFLTDRPQDVYVKGKPDPVLLAVMMRAGAYGSKTTGKAVTRPSQIDGPVFNRDTYDIVLTEDDLKAGLVDKFGKPLKTGFGKLFQMGRDMVTKSWDRLKKAGQWIGGQFGRVLGAAKTGFENIIGKDGLIFAGSRKMQTTIEEIRDLLDDRLPGKKRVFGDTNGDGVRDNSLQDLKRKRDAKAEKEQANKAAGEEKKGGAFAGAIAALKKMFSKKEDKDEGGDGDTYIMGGGEGGGDKDGKGKGKDSKPKSRWGRFKGRLGGLGRGILNLGKGALLGGGAAMAANAVGLGDYAGTIGTAVGLGSMIPGVGTALGAAASGLGTAAVAAGGGLLTLLGAIASSPVLLGGALAAGAGYGLYKAFKWLTKEELSTLSTVRFGQYGFTAKQSDYADVVLSLENQLRSAVRIKHDGTATLLDSKMNFKELIKAFDVDPKDSRAVSNWAEWFAYRFKPVFLHNVAAAKEVSPSLWLGDVDKKLSAEEKLKFLSLSKSMDGAPYSVYNSPFPKLKHVSVDSNGVAELFKAAEEKIGKDVKDPAKAGAETPGTESSKAGAAIGAAAAALAANPDASSNGSTGSMPHLRNQTGQPSATDTKAGTVSVASGPLAMSRVNGGRIDALTAIRYKTYGLMELTADKVRTLEMLEELIQKDLIFDSKKGATWSGSVDRVLVAAGPAFGVSGVQNTDAYQWKSWFNYRFLPTFVNFMSAGYAATGKTTVLEIMAGLRPAQLVDVAMSVYTTTSTYNGTVAVWMVPDTPWPGYIPNRDVKSTDDNLQALKDQAKKAVLDEETAKGNNTSAQSAAAQQSTSFWDRVFGGNKGKDPANGKPGYSSTEGGAAFGVYGGRGRAQGTNAGGVDNMGFPVNNSGGSGDGSAMTGGQSVQHPGNGTGGDVNSLPDPEGDGSWTGLSKLIMAASKMVGVDPKLMATMAAIESGFRIKAKAGTSSASGLYQFINSTWKATLGKYGAKYGLSPDASPFDPKANVLMGAEFLKENANAIKGAVKGRDLTDTDLYLAHFLGAGGARKFLSADPNAIAANSMPEAARANASIFFKNGRPLTFAEVYQVINGRVRSKGKQFGIDIPASEMPGSDTAPVGTVPNDAAAPAASSAAPASMEDPSGGGANLKVSNNPMGDSVPVSDVPMGPAATPPPPVSIPPASAGPASNTVESSTDTIPEFTPELAYKTVGHTADGSEIFYDVMGNKQVRQAETFGPKDPFAAQRAREKSDKEAMEDELKGYSGGDYLRRKAMRERSNRLLAEAGALEANSSNMKTAPTETAPQPQPQSEPVVTRDVQLPTQTMSPRVMDMTAMANAQAAATQTGFGGVTSVLERGVTLQERTVSLLEKIVGHLDTMATKGSASQPAPSPMRPAQPRAASQSPVSMLKPT